MAVDGDAAVRVRVLVPEEPVLVADPADPDRVGKGPEAAGGVVHHHHAPADPPANGPDHGALLRRVARAPAVHLEGRVSPLQALLREVRVRLRAGQAAVQAVAAEGARVGGKPLAKAAEHRRHGDPLMLSGEVPEGHVERADPQLPEMHGRAPHGPVVALALEGGGPEEPPGERLAGRHRDLGPPPRRDVLAAHPFVGVDADREPHLGLAGAGGVADVEPAPVRADPRHGDLEGGQLDAGDGGRAVHGAGASDRGLRAREVWIMRGWIMPISSPATPSAAFSTHPGPSCPGSPGPVRRAGACPRGSGGADSCASPAPANFALARRPDAGSCGPLSGSITPRGAVSSAAPGVAR